MGKQKVKIYTCDKHNWTLEDRNPIDDPAALRVWCPLCRDDLFAQHLPVPNCKIEWRDRPEVK